MILLQKGQAYVSSYELVRVRGRDQVWGGTVGITKIEGKRISLADLVERTEERKVSPVSPVSTSDISH